MAVLNFYQPAEMAQFAIWYGYVTAATSTQLSLTNYAGLSGTYFGYNLTYNSWTVTGGTVTGYDGYDGYSLAYSARGANINAITLANLVNSGNAAAVISFGLAGNDTINGSIYADSLLASSGNDIITGGGGNDYIDGGNGKDTAVYSGAFSQYGISSGTRTIVDTVVARDGVDTLIGIERLQFSDTMVALDIGPTQTAGSAYMLYQAAFNRKPDAAGLGYWINAVDKGADITKDVATFFVTSPEFVAKYGSNPTNASYVDNLYQNVLHRSGEAGGVAYWNQELNAGRVTRAAVLEAFATLPEGASLVAADIAHGITYAQWVT